VATAAECGSINRRIAPVSLLNDKGGEPRARQKRKRRKDPLFANREDSISRTHLPMFALAKPLSAWPPSRAIRFQRRLTKLK
jgi:hypothetical protein